MARSEMVAKSTYNAAKNQIQKLEGGRKNALAALREIKARTPARAATQAVLTVGSAYSAGALDAALQNSGVALPSGARPSQVVGVAAGVAALAAAYGMGSPTMANWIAPIAAGYLAPTAYSMGAGHYSQIAAAVNK